MIKRAPLLVVFCGLPGTGKTTIAHQLAAQTGATFLRIDVIELAIHKSGVVPGGIGPSGYMVAYALAESNLALGRMVVADSVNPVQASREAWRGMAVSASAPLLEVEIICSDSAEHRRRVEERISDLAGFVLPGWPEVAARHYEPWPEPHLVIDTALVSAADAVARIRAAIQQIGGAEA